jgi:hypothetical protein
MITYTTQPDGSFVKTGELPEGTDRVQFQISDPAASDFYKKPSLKDYTLEEATTMIEGTYARKCARFASYTLFPSTLNKRATKDEMNSKIMQKRKKNKAEREGEEWGSAGSYVSPEED